MDHAERVVVVLPRLALEDGLARVRRDEPEVQGARDRRRRIVARDHGANEAQTVESAGCRERRHRIVPRERAGAFDEVGIHAARIERRARSTPRRTHEEYRPRHDRASVARPRAAAVIVLAGSARAAARVIPRASRRRTSNSSARARGRRLWSSLGMLGGSAADFESLQAALSDTTQVCSYFAGGSRRESRRGRPIWPTRPPEWPPISSARPWRRTTSRGRTSCSGWSYGGLVAQAFAARHRDALAGLVLEDSATRPNGSTHRNGVRSRGRKAAATSTPSRRTDEVGGLDARRACRWSC